MLTQGWKHSLWWSPTPHQKPAMEAALSGHGQSSISNLFLSNHYLTERMGLAVLLLHKWQISLPTHPHKHTNTHRRWCSCCRPWWDLLMDQPACGCWTSLFWMGWTSLPRWKKGERDQWKHPRLFPRRARADPTGRQNQLQPKWLHAYGSHTRRHRQSQAIWYVFSCRGT